MRIALCQIDTTIGAFTQNIEKMCEFLRQAATEKADLAVFPELCLSSYPPLDLLDRPEFLAANEAALEKFRTRLNQIDGVPQAVVVGSIVAHPGAQGRSLQNGALVFHKGELVHTQLKRLLPTYDVFDEARYFEPAQETEFWESPFGKIGFSVCEDAWFEDLHHGRKIYLKDPAESLRGCDLAINISASPFEHNKRGRRDQMLRAFVKRIGAPLVYVNQVGANDEILFDGSSLVYTAEGEVSFEMPSFREGVAVVELDRETGSTKSIASFQYHVETPGHWDKMFPEKADNDSEIGLLHKALVTGVRDYFRKTGFKRAVLGLSGGIDSAVVACLAAEALGPRNVLGVSLPSQYSSSHSLADAEALARAVGLEYRVHSVKFVFTTLLMELKSSFGGQPVDVTEENIQARLRAVMLMGLANKRHALVLTTGNKSELAVGYCTTYGDMAGALAPLGDVYKTKVYALARHINSRYKWIPESTMTKPPSAELRPDQTDQDSLPPYDLLDRLLEHHLEGSAGSNELIKAGFDPAIVEKILSLVRVSEFKRRQAAPVLKVTSKAFGLGRRIPIAKSF